MDVDDDDDMSTDDDDDVSKTYEDYLKQYRMSLSKAQTSTKSKQSPLILLSRTKSQTLTDFRAPKYA